MDVRSWLKGKRVGVVFGGRSAEREISLLSGKAVLKALKKMGFNAVGIDAGSGLPEKLKSKKIDLCITRCTALVVKTVLCRECSK